MRTVTVNASVSYKILIEKNLLVSSGKHIKDCFGNAKLCIVTDDTVDALYSSTLEASLTSEGLSFIKFVIPHGEASKNAENLVSLLELMAESRLTRADAIIALGGGVVGDLAGFAAGIYLRGIRFAQIPTTLLAMVDSSVGGKTAIDLKAGKNLAGVFHQPSLVLCDPNALNTLPSDIFSDGCAEVIKYGIINDRAFFDSLKLGIRESIEDVIERCVSIKARIVELDEFDNGTRQLLNLGHTAGHAVELCSDFTVSHGSAVAIGTVIATKIAYSLKLCSKLELDETVALISAQGLPTKSPYSASQLAKIATADKKRSGDSISFVIP
ncbi:MAG: 3-dehydroquinate synthase, partial [Clostridia bacterium]|nr:3-dehydroquinate synthase [Clostridia bacterium]